MLHSMGGWIMFLFLKLFFFSFIFCLLLPALLDSSYLATSHGLGPKIMVKLENFQTPTSLCPAIIRRSLAVL